MGSGGYRARLQSERRWEERSDVWATGGDRENKFSTTTKQSVGATAEDPLNVQVTTLSKDDLSS